MDEERAFAIVERQIETKRNPLPKVRRKVDGFSRQDVVDAFATTFEMIGGISRMALWANANPDKFYPLYARLLPSAAITIGDNSIVQIVHALPPTKLDEHEHEHEQTPGGQ